MTLDIFHEERFLQPKCAGVGEPCRGLQGHIQAITLIRVRHDDKVFTELAPHGANDADILIQVKSDFNFDPVKTLLSEGARPGGDFRWFLRVQGSRVNRHFVAALPA